MSDPLISRRPYYYRRRLRVRELVPAIGVGIGAGILAFYVARLLLERTPLVTPPPGPRARGRRSVPARP